jgi:hypothetical protein
VQILAGNLLLSATDVVNFLGCRQATYLDLRDLADPVEISERDAATVLIFEKGLEHEKRHLASLKAQGLSILEIPGEGFDVPERTALTREVMRAYLSGGFDRASLARLCRFAGTGGGGIEPRCLELRGRRHQAASQGETRTRHTTHQLLETDR